MTAIDHTRRLACTCCRAEAASFRATAVSRRKFLAGGLAAFGLGSSTGIAAEVAQPPTILPTRIDVHHHFLAPFHRDVFLKHRRGSAPPDWSVDRSLEDMEKSGTATAILSIMQPGVWFGNVDEARRLARDCNEYAARIVQEHPRRFGLFAAIPLPDMDGSLREIEYSLDVLKADGIALLTSYQDKYLGDTAFLPVFEELNRRKSVVYVHPTTPDCCRGLIKGVPPSTIEYATDTTRTIASLIFGAAGTAFRCPDIRFIWSHSGGTLPFLTGRFVRLANERNDPRMPNGPNPIFRKYFYEVAQGTTPGQLAALMKLVAISQILFGTDYPFRPGLEAVQGIAEFHFSAGDQALIERGSALTLLPRLRDL